MANAAMKTIFSPPARRAISATRAISSQLVSSLFLTLTLALLLGDVIPHYEDDAKRQIWDIRFSLRKELSECLPSIARIAPRD